MNIWGTIAVATLALLATQAGASDDYPNRPITLIVPYSPGSAADNSMRPFSRVLSEKLGQTVIIDNKPGAGGILGMEIGAAAKPDGYTLIFGSSGPMATFTSLYKKLSYDPAKSFTLVRVGALNPYVMVANPSKPYKTLAEFIDYAKKHPDTINFGSPGLRHQQSSRRRAAAIADRNQKMCPTSRALRSRRISSPACWTCRSSFRADRAQTSRRANWCRWQWPATRG